MLCNNKILKYFQDYNCSHEIVNTFPWRILRVLISPEEYCVFWLPLKKYMYCFSLKNSACFDFSRRLLCVFISPEEYCVFWLLLKNSVLISPKNFVCFDFPEEFCVFLFPPKNAVCFYCPWRSLCFDFLWRILCILVSNKLMLRLKRKNQNQIPSFKSLEQLIV
jgi:hypothetical protein